MADYRYSNCPPQVPLPNFNETRCLNYNSIHGVNAAEATNNHMPYQTQVNPAPNDNFVQHGRENFPRDHTKNSPAFRDDQCYPHSNNIVASNPFETSVTNKNVPFVSHSPIYRASPNEMHNFNHLPEGSHVTNLTQMGPSYNQPPNSRINFQNNVQFQNRDNSPGPKVSNCVPQMHISQSVSYTNQNINNSKYLPMSHQNSVNASSLPYNEVPFCPPANSQLKKPYEQQSQFPHNPSCSDATNMPPVLVDMKPNFTFADNSGQKLNQSIPQAQNMGHRPIFHPHLNNMPVDPNLPHLNSQSVFTFRGIPPTNVPPMLPPVITKLEQNVPVQTCLPPIPQTFNQGPDPAMCQMPPNSYNSMFPQDPLPVQINTIPSPMPPVYHFPQQSFAPFQGTFPSENSTRCGDFIENKLSNFLLRFQSTILKKSNKNQQSITVAEYRSALKVGCTLLKLVYSCKGNLSKSVHLEESVWNSEVNKVTRMKEQLSSICNVLSNNNHIQDVQQKLKKIKKKRDQKKNQKQLRLLYKEKCRQERKELDQKIDRWLDLIKEKNLKLKREAEMKKEADDILSEVRRKIQEANRTLEKLKVFEKLRNARKDNAVQKSLFVLPSHDVNFEKKVTELRTTMLKQLSDYEAEERALKVMLETEQEGQLEEEARWRLERLKNFQKRKQKDIIDSLFGTTEELQPSDPLFFFYQHHNFGNSSIENLVQVRHHWDIFLVPPETEEASTVPQQWVVPEPPKNLMWEIAKKE